MEISEIDVINFFKSKLSNISSIDLEKTHGFSYEGSRVKINFHLKSVMSKEESNSVCRLFTHSDKIITDNNYNILNPKYFVLYLTFQCFVSDDYQLKDGEIPGRFIVSLKGKEVREYIISEIRDDKLDSILNG